MTSISQASYEAIDKSSINSCIMSKAVCRQSNSKMLGCACRVFSSQPLENDGVMQREHPTFAKQSKSELTIEVCASQLQHRVHGVQVPFARKFVRRSICLTADSTAPEIEQSCSAQVLGILTTEWCLSRYASNLRACWRR